MKKYKLIKSDIKGFYRVRALRSFSDVKEGDIGGYVQGEHNLSHCGDCWIYGDATVSDMAIVAEGAEVSGHARVFARASVFGYALVHGEAWVGGNARMYNNAKAGGNAAVEGRVTLAGSAWVSGRASVGGTAVVKGMAAVSSDAKVFGRDIVTGKTLFFAGLPRHDITVTDNHVNIGCEQHTIEDWLEIYEDVGREADYSEKEVAFYYELLQTISRLKQVKL